MANLLPPDAKKNVRKEYWLRTASVWTLLLAICFVIFVALLVPTYVLIGAQHRAVTLQDSDLEINNEAYSESVVAIERANTLARQLQKTPQHLLPSEALSVIESVQDDAIVLTGFFYTTSEDAEDTISVTGIAANRTTLVSFRETLERSPFFKEATVPVSDLVRDQNLPFTITITIAMHTQ